MKANAHLEAQFLSYFAGKAGELVGELQGAGWGGGGNPEERRGGGGGMGWVNRNSRALLHNEISAM